MARVQVVQDGTELKADLQHLIHRQRATALEQHLLQGLTLDKVHDEIPVSRIGKMLIDARQIRMRQLCQQFDLTVEGIGGIDHLLWTQPLEVNLFNRYKASLRPRVKRLVDCAETARPYGQ